MPPKRCNTYKRLLFDLVKRLIESDNDEEAFTAYLRYAHQLKPQKEGSTFEYSETYLAEKIKETLKSSVSSNLVPRFEELHRRLQNGNVLKNREAVMFFLFCMGNRQKERSRGSSTVRFADNATLPLIISSPKQNYPFPSLCIDPRSTSSILESWLPTGSEKSVSSAFPSPVGDVLHSSSDKKTSRNHSTYTSTVASTDFHEPLSYDCRAAQGDCSKKGFISTSNRNHISETASARTQESAFGRGVIGDYVATENVGAVYPLPLPTVTISDNVILQDLIFSFQGILGTLLKLDPTSLGYKLDLKFSISRPTQRAVLRLTELGWLHNTLRRFCEDMESLSSLGPVEKGLVGALREELIEYYRLVAVIQTPPRQQPFFSSVDSSLMEEPLLGSAGSSGMTLRSLGVWALDPTERMRCLVSIAETSRKHKGGALASAVHYFLQSGDPVERRTARHILSAVCKPLYEMLSRWVADGELDDPFGEFFIVADPRVTGERLWYDKYRVQRDLLPIFISIAEANNILETGKSINFLREICKDKTPIRGCDMLRQALDAANVEALFSPDRDDDLCQVMETAYQEVSRRVLDVLSGPHKFLQNLQALRRYLLLGQGDFIRYFMEIINPELCKPAYLLYGHILSGILETAIRATNAQFEDPGILNRLDVRLLEVNAGDIGWDVFSLDYHFGGPISTIFVPSANSYLMLFSTLWRVKRSEYVLTGSWKRQTTAMRILRKLPELTPVLKRTHLLSAEMIHMVQQMQYYMLFEIVECSWHEMLGKLRQAKTLEDILKAHMQFLDKAKAGALLDNGSKSLAARLRMMHSLVLNFEKIETDLYNCALEELDARNAHEKAIHALGAAGKFGINTSEEKVYEEARADFKNKYVRVVLTKLNILATVYQEQIKNFLLELAVHPNNNLQLLSFRLDFNDHYKRLEPRLATPHTYQHRRLSESENR